MFRRLILLLILLTLLTGCRWLKLKMGIGYTVTNPEEESPQWVVQQVLKAAAKEPFSDAWRAYTQYLHSSEKDTRVGLKDWETLRFPALRRKHRCFLRDAGPFSYLVKEEREVRDDYVQLRVLCKTTDTPTPCHLFKDPNANGKWRVKMNCLN
ncbi:MAG TPA: hypothetical protein EYN66_17645 [Myxococcales bacterium]|nr:hypothetical protein [Myxococcales bacterium]